MEAVGIRELKAHLSRYVQQVKQGQEGLVTERGQAIAILAPLSPEQPWVATLRRSGPAKGRGGKPKGCRGIHPQGESMAKTMCREREAGW